MPVLRPNCLKKLDIPALISLRMLVPNETRVLPNSTITARANPPKTSKVGTAEFATCIHPLVGWPTKQKKGREEIRF